MTKDQEVIERLTNGEKIDFNTLIRKFKKEGIENFVVTKKEYIETVLNILKEKDKEVEIYKTVYNKALADLVKADRKNIENKMQIDLMAEMIDKLSEYYTRYHGKNNEFCKEICIEKDIDCINCIKQYFVDLVEKE